MTLSTPPTASLKLHGTGVGRGYAFGPVLRMPEPLPDPQDHPSMLTIVQEQERAATSLSATAATIRRRGERAGGSAQDVLDAQAMMAEDPALAEDVKARISVGKTAERAVYEAFAGFRDALLALGGYLAERASDLDDVSQRVVAHLRGVAAPGVPESDEPFVLVAHDLAPADTALLDLEKVRGLITSDGGPTSHTAILAREKSIPALVGTGGARDLQDGQLVIVDAASGVVTVNPSEAEISEVKAAIAQRGEVRAALVVPGALGDGRPMPLLANLGSVDDVRNAVTLGAEGVGLFRTEFLFLDAKQAPTVAEQAEQYTRLLAAFRGQKVVVRVLDAGADKPLSFLNEDREENPALGVRGLRALRANEQILRDQLNALAQADAATDADLWVMAPMVATVEEARYFTAVARELGIRTVGVMVEIPSSALLADRILQVADFASVGTNDLTQYTLGADRMLGTVSAYQNPWHPAVLRLIHEVGCAGAALSKPVGICGEAAADPLLAVVLAGLGATSLSMSPSAFADVREELARHTFADAQRFAERALAADSAAAARSAVMEAISAS
ncbi:phosphoenolpyruvate--protein phosphotransferase [Rathayibacter toxicus]|uniref:phosphoenolpyruvate--protein phosphotransferase n=1 Tax=Rathayibacter toxicus TaxID=145458 RepID=UPI001C052727|nr:phosphoenolpyruvate--protein phosphotransferase [Rathayibacter toxicus]QWL32941.1 phosphoenolpyruvate--protein phosphotransferase [Rathayibacter toxicus]QWL35035.1 phosphoenolpyruvate--protein phosphotransferase [Rathayibacter toxicus]QWL37166.1 phosphoenolpyruvate--protein phosphotransferase [Rathayibacter toxicus]QWL39258.1 phosphoenolpyruvate--protein phosphotransferase [Rathayibacter toxicus]QWL41344.1 phosphoenolpyruvate--protein phosphotransferase [Rathayibacter toxicus]